MPKYRVPLYEVRRKFVYVEAPTVYDADVIGTLGDVAGYEGKVYEETEWEFYYKQDKDEIEAEEWYAEPYEHWGNPDWDREK